VATSARSPVVIFVAMAVSVVAVVVLWFAPVAGLVIAGLVVLGGLAVVLTGRKGVGAVVCLMPLAVAILLLQIAGLFLVKAYRVPSGSMEHTIEIGDRVIVNRRPGTPSLGDIVVAKPPSGALDDSCGARKPRDAACPQATPGLANVKYVKRVVAGPGDTVAFVHGLLVRNGHPVREPYARPCSDQPLCELPRPIKLSAGTWFLAGDFRGASDDSRIWGPVPTNAIVGRVAFRYWPPKSVGRI